MLLFLLMYVMMGNYMVFLWLVFMFCCDGMESISFGFVIIVGVSEMLV